MDPLHIQKIYSPSRYNFHFLNTLFDCSGEILIKSTIQGVDTGERYVRLKPKGSTQIPDYVTVGGCKILIRVLTQEEVGQPFTLQSYSSRTEPGDSVTSPPMGCRSATLPHSTYRAKPGHCNGSLTSPSAELLPPFPPLSLPSDMSPIPRGSGADSAGSSISLPSSPKIARSFRSRISVTLRSPPNVEDTASSTYVPGESVDLPMLSPPAYRGQANGSSTLPNGASSCGLDGLSTTACPAASSLEDSNRESPSASSLRKYAIQNNNLHKTESSHSINSLGRSTADSSLLPPKDANGSTKRASVVFEEPKGGSFQSGSSSSMLTQNRQVSTSKTVNGILRKASLRGDEEKKEEKSRKTRKASESHRHKGERSHSSSRKSSRPRGSKLDSVNESGDDPDGWDGKRSSRSRSNSTKSTKSEKKDANNIALTRDLPWCGCWGNGCL